MHEPDQPDRVFDPPRPVWVREVDRNGDDWAVEGWLHAWVQLEEFGGLRWCARTSTHNPDDRKLLPDTSVLPRDL